MKIKKIIFFSLLVMAGLPGYAQRINIFHESAQTGYTIYASNKELYPVSILLNFTLTNLQFTQPANKILVIPANTEKFKLGELTYEDPSGRYKFSYTFRKTMGDLTLNNTDQRFEYDLPFRKGQRFKIYQGYHGVFSHQDENAIDFGMPDGADILVAREGLVVEIVQNNTESCPEEECKKYNNYIIVMHDDGTFAYYAHIKYNSAKCKVGDKVKSGDMIASCGNVGRTNGPHLHFACFTGSFGKWNTLSTKFKIDTGVQTAVLAEGQTYQRDY